MNQDPLQYLMSVRQLHLQMMAMSQPDSLGGALSSDGPRGLASFGTGLTAASFGISDSTRIVQQGGTDFFGAVGALLSQFAGLTVEGKNGMPVPIFTSDLGFGGIDPSLTLEQRARTDANSKMYQAMSGQASSVFGSMTAGLLAPNSMLAGWAYEKDANGEYVQSSTVRNFFDQARQFASGPYGVMLTAPMLNKVLGYDIGAGANVIQQRIGNMVTGAFNPDGSPYIDFDNPALDRRRMDVSAGLHAALQNYMRTSSGVQNYDNTFGMRDKTIARIQADMYQAGAYSGLDFGRGMDEADIKAEETRTGNLDAMKAMNSAIEEARREIEQISAKPGPKTKADLDRIKELNAGIDKSTTRLSELNAENAELLGSESTFDWSEVRYGDGTRTMEVTSLDEAFEVMGDARRRMEAAQKKAASLTKRRSEAIKGGSASQDEINRLTQQIVDATNEAMNEGDYVARLSRAVNGLKEAKDRSVVGLVASLKNLYGSEEAALSAVQQIAGNSYARPEFARQMNADVMALGNFGAAAGIGAAVQGTMLMENAGIAAYAIAGDEAQYGFGRGAGAAILATRRTGNEMLRIARLTGDEAQRAHRAARAEGEAEAQSTMTKFGIVLEWARKNNAITGDEYESYRDRLKSGSDKVMDTAATEMMARLFGGDMAQNAALLNNRGFIERLYRDLDVDNFKNINEIFGAATGREIVERANRDRIDIQSRGLTAVGVDNGISGTVLRDAKVSGEFEVVKRKLDESRNPKDQSVSREFNARYEALLERYGNTEEGQARARLEALRYFDTALRGEVSAELSEGFDTERGEAGVARQREIVENGGDFAGALATARAIELFSGNRLDGADNQHKKRLQELQVRLDAARRGNKAEEAGAIQRDLESLAAEMGLSERISPFVDRRMDMFRRAASFAEGSEGQNALQQTAGAATYANGSIALTYAYLDRLNSTGGQMDWANMDEEAIDDFIKKNREAILAKVGDRRAGVELLLDGLVANNGEDVLDAFLNKGIGKEGRQEVLQMLAGPNALVSFGKFLEEQGLPTELVPFFLKRERLDKLFGDNETYKAGREEAKAKGEEDKEYTPPPPAEAASSSPAASSPSPAPASSPASAAPPETPAAAPAAAAPAEGGSGQPALPFAGIITEVESVVSAVAGFLSSPFTQDGGKAAPSARPAAATGGQSQQVENRVTRDDVRELGKTFRESMTALGEAIVAAMKAHAAQAVVANNP